MARVVAFLNSASRVSDEILNSVSSGAGGGSRLKISSARLLRGTSRFLRVFTIFAGRWATAPRTYSGMSLQISPARIPVSIANRTVVATSWLFVWLATSSPPRSKPSAKADPLNLVVRGQSIARLVFLRPAHVGGGGLRDPLPLRQRDCLYQPNRLVELALSPSPTLPICKPLTEDRKPE
jgi:hypothetical protein